MGSGRLILSGKAEGAVQSVGEKRAGGSGGKLRGQYRTRMRSERVALDRKLRRQFTAWMRSEGGPGGERAGNLSGERENRTKCWREARVVRGREVMRNGPDCGLCWEVSGRCWAKDQKAALGGGTRM